MTSGNIDHTMQSIIIIKINNISSVFAIKNVPTIVYTRTRQKKIDYNKGVW